MTAVQDKHEEIDIEGDVVPAGSRKITWFKASGIMTPTVLSAEVIELILASELRFGNAARVPYRDETPNGFSIVHAWFGENFPLPEPQTRW